ncbi:MAG: hypothetical protein Ct9H300mP28_19120 [Pseudomonadota bacterium]|nr:MAG: hypothetical protein Ct9H300mP28_19120 [Pseudomonadota bacterium]
MFESLNQLDDILEFIDFKEVKADIISDMSRTIQNYIHLKPDIHSDFFKFFSKSTYRYFFQNYGGAI